MIQRLPKREFESWSTDDLEPGDFIQAHNNQYLLFVVRKVSTKEYQKIKNRVVVPEDRNCFFLIPITHGKINTGDLYILAKFLTKGHTRIPCSM